MTKIKLKYNPCIMGYTLTDAEARRASALLDKGELLTYRSNEGLITIADGVLTYEGFSEICRAFGTDTPIGVPNADSEAVTELKARIRGVVVGEGATVIGIKAFAGYVNLTEVIIPDGVKRIGDESFKGCASLTELHIPDSVTSISDAFVGCDALLPYTLPSGLVSLSGRVFGIYPERVVLPEGVESIYKAFCGSDVKSVYIPGGCKNIGYRSFAGCSKLVELVLCEGIESIDQAAFADCTSLRSVKIPRTVGVIRSYAFGGCTSLADVDMPEGCLAASNAFEDTPYHRIQNAGRVDTLPKIPYEGDVANIPALDEMRAVLSGLSLREQATHLTVTVESCEESSSYGISEGEQCSSSHRLLSEDTSAEGLVMLDGIIVGVSFGEHIILAGEHKCIYSATDEDGAGSRSVTEYRGFSFTG